MCVLQSSEECVLCVPLASAALLNSTASLLGNRDLVVCDDVQCFPQRGGRGGTVPPFH